MLDLKSKNICHTTFQPKTINLWVLWLFWLLANQQFFKSSILQMRTNGAVEKTAKLIEKSIN
jgi:hypothetical protein